MQVRNFFFLGGVGFPFPAREWKFFLQKSFFFAFFFISLFLSFVKRRIKAISSAASGKNQRNTHVGIRVTLQYMTALYPQMCKGNKRNHVIRCLFSSSCFSFPHLLSSPLPQSLLILEVSLKPFLVKKVHHFQESGILDLLLSTFLKSHLFYGHSLTLKE